MDKELSLLIGFIRSWLAGRVCSAPVTASGCESFTKCGEIGERLTEIKTETLVTKFG